MKRNSRNQSAAVRFGPAVKAAVLLLLFGGSAVGYVWQKNQIQNLGRQMKEIEVKLERLRDDNRKLGQELVILRSPVYLARRAKELNLGLSMPSQAQVLRISETPPERGLISTGQHLNLHNLDVPARHVTLR